MADPAAANPAADSAAADPAVADPAAADPAAADPAAADPAAADPAAADPAAADPAEQIDFAQELADAELRDAQDNFLLNQKYLQEKFWKYRTGDDTYNRPLGLIEHDYLWDIRKAALRRLRTRQVPRVDYRRLDREAKRIIRAPWAYVNRVFYRQPAPDPNANQPARNRNRDVFNIADMRKVTGRQEFRRAGAMIEAAKRDFAFVKVLGSGGNGMVVLWKWNPRGKPQDGGLDVVMKFSIARDADFDIVWQDIDDEHTMTSTFVRAPHIAQIVFFRDRVPDPPRRSLRSQQAREAQNLDDAEGLLFLEYAKLGDLKSWLERLGSSQNHLPPAALWRLFDCLVKACNAMEYAPFSALPSLRNGPPLAEEIRFGALDGKQPGWEGVVHFDLDPKNILVAGYDQQESNNPREPDHTQMPRFQLGDFGIAKYGAWCWRHTIPLDRPNISQLRIVRRRTQTWGQREMAKPKWFLPEQFSSEWDQYELNPDEGAANEFWPPEWYPWEAPFSGPGRYTYKSNIWHIGMNMFCTLLLQEPDFPPVAGRMRSAEPPQFDPVPMRHQRWTYGYRLIADNAEGQGYRQRFTPLLCETIAKCLMAKQEHRPNLIELQRIIRVAISDGPALPDAVRNFFGNDAPPPLPPFLDYTSFDFATMDPFDPYPGFSDSPIPPPIREPRRRRRRGRHAPLEDRAYRP